MPFSNRIWSHRKNHTAMIKSSFLGLSLLLPSIPSAAIAKHMLQLVSPVGWCWSLESLGSCPVVTLCWRQNDHRERCTQDQGQEPPRPGTTHTRRGTQYRNYVKIQSKGYEWLILLTVIFFVGKALFKDDPLPEKYADWSDQEIQRYPLPSVPRYTVGTTVRMNARARNHFRCWDWS